MATYLKVRLILLKMLVQNVPKFSNFLWNKIIKDYHSLLMTFFWIRSFSFWTFGYHSASHYSKWPKDIPFLLMYSRHASNLYDSKIKIVFEIAWTLFAIILFSNLNKHLDGARSTLKINFFKWLIIITSNEDIWPHKNFHAWGEK